LVNKFPDVARGALSSALMDRNASVRSLARFHLNDRDREWFRNFYLEALSSVSPRDLPMAIAGLAETGAEADAEILAPFLASERARIRRAAVRWLIRLGGEEYVELVFRCVMDSSPGVSNEARGAVSQSVNSIGGNRIWSEFNSQHAMHVRRNLLRLLAILPKWEALGHLLTACTDTEANIADIALQFLERWNARFNKNQLAPGPEELASAQAALSTASSRIPRKTAEDIRFVMHSFEVT